MKKFKEFVEGVIDDQRQFHMALTKVGYGLGRPQVINNELVYNTSDPEDAEDIAAQVPEIAKTVGVIATGRVVGRTLCVSIG